LILPARYVVSVALMCVCVVLGCQGEPQAPPETSPEAPAEISIDPDTLRFECDNRHRDATMSEVVSVSNTGGGSMEWSASTDALWVTVTPKEGQGNSGDVTVHVNPSALAVGLHEAMVLFDGNGGQETVDVSLMVLRYTETSHVTLQIDPTRQTRNDWTYGNRSTQIRPQNHQEVNLKWTVVGAKPNVYVMLGAAPWITGHGAATRPGGKIDSFVNIPEWANSISPVRFGHSNGDATDSGDVTLYFSETIDRVGQKTLYPPGFYDLVFEVLAASPDWYSFGVLYGSEVTVELDITVRDTDEALGD